MHSGKFWLFLMVISCASSMERSVLPEHYQITILPNQTKKYKCLLCEYRPVLRETCFLNHWVKHHNTTVDYTLEVWKEACEQCNQCSTYFQNKSSLKLHIMRKHNTLSNTTSKKYMELLERSAIFKLYDMSQS